MDMKEAVICRLNDVIRQRNITVNEAAVPHAGTRQLPDWTRIYFSLDEGDIIIFQSGGRLLVKRIAAAPGDTIDLDALIYMAGMEQPYREDSILVDPEDCYLVLGDNTQNSYDSRYWDDPFVREEDIVAKLLWP